MTLDIPINEYNETAVKLALADEYDVHPNLISIASSAGSLVILVTIASSGTSEDGSALSVPLSTLRDRIERRDDATLSMSLASVLGTNLTVSSTEVQQGTVDRTVSFVCPRGKWCTAGIVVNCTERTYNVCQQGHDPVVLLFDLLADWSGCVRRDICWISRWRGRTWALHVSLAPTTRTHRRARSAWTTAHATRAL